jgi:hypothetical protein
MSAQIVVQTGISAGTHYWIDKFVLRIGCDPDLDISLLAPDIDQHAVTLEFRLGSYFVHNRSQAVLKLSSETVMPGEAGQWLPGLRLELGAATKLELTVEGDPAPCPRPLDEAAQTAISGDDSEEEEATDDQKKSSKSMMQMAVALVCLLGAGLLLTSDGPTAPQTPNVPGFTAVVQSAQASPSTSPELIRRLQYAQAMLIRGDIFRAKSHFLSLRDDLVKQHERFRANNMEEELNILAYVNHQVGRLR